MLAVIIVAGIAFALQGFFSFMQMKHLNNEFIKLRRKGKVAFGRKSGGFHAGAIVMFRIDEDGIIQEGKKLEGTTAFARVKPLDLTEEDGPQNHRNLRKAIADAALTYRKYQAGELVPETAAPTPLEKRISQTRILRKAV